MIRGASRAAPCEVRLAPVRAGGAHRPAGASVQGSELKLVIGIVRPEKANDVLEALYRAEVRG